MLLGSIFARRLPVLFAAVGLSLAFGASPGAAASDGVIKVKGSKKVAFSRFFFATLPGAVVGKACQGCMVEREFVWMDNIGPGTFDGLSRYGNKAMRDAGYDVMFPKSLLFGDESVHHARYLLGAWISDLNVNTAYQLKS